MKTLDEVGNDIVPALTAAFDRAGVTKDRAVALSTFKAEHAIYADDDGVLYTHYNGHKQELHAALTAWGKTQEGESFLDRRTLPKSEQNHTDGIRAKSDLKTVSEKTAFIAKHGAATFEKLPTKFISPSEVKYRDEYYALTREQKSALINQGVTAATFPPRPDPNQIAGGRVNKSALERDKATRPNQK